MGQLHKQFIDEQVRLLLQTYCDGILDRPTVQEVLGVGKARFFALPELNCYPELLNLPRRHPPV